MTTASSLLLTGQITLNPFLDLDHGFFASLPDLPDGNYGKKFCKEDIEQDEKRETTDRLAYLHPRRDVKSLLPGEPRVDKRRDHNGETLQPHADRDRDGGHDRPCNGPGLSVAKNGKRDHKTRHDHRPEIRGIFAGKFGVEYGHVHRFVAVKCGEVFREGKIKPKKRHHQEEDAEIIEVDLF